MENSNFDMDSFKEDISDMISSMKEEVLEQTKELVSGIVAKTKHSESKEKTGSNDDIDSYLDKIINKLEERTHKEKSVVFDTLFDDKVNELTSKFGSFKDHLNSKDYRGRVIIDELKNIEDYKERIETLNNVFNTFAQAVSNEPDGTVSKEVRKLVKDHTDKRESIKEKFLNGDTDLDTFTEEFFNSIESQMESIK